MAQKTRVTVDDQKDYTQYISFVGTQSAANAYLEIPINTLVVPADEFILEIQEVQWEVQSTLLTSTSNNPEFRAALSRVSAALPAVLSDPALLAKDKLQFIGGGAFTVAYQAPVESPRVMAYSGKQIIAQQTVYFQFQCTGMSAALAIGGRIYYKQVPMTKDRILEILYG